MRGRAPSAMAGLLAPQRMGGAVTLWWLAVSRWRNRAYGTGLWEPASLQGAAQRSRGEARLSIPARGNFRTEMLTFESSYLGKHLCFVGWLACIRKSSVLRARPRARAAYHRETASHHSVTAPLWRHQAHHRSALRSDHCSSSENEMSCQRADQNELFSHMMGGPAEATTRK
jgi:hypothetical protein